jgi:hypothetical protein
MFERLNVEKHECPHCKTSDKLDFGLFDLVKRPLPRGESGRKKLLETKKDKKKRRRNLDYITREAPQAQLQGKCQNFWEVSSWSWAKDERDGEE